MKKLRSTTLSKEIKIQAKKERCTMYAVAVLHGYITPDYKYTYSKKEAWHFESKEKAMFIAHKLSGKVTMINKGYL